MATTSIFRTRQKTMKPVGTELTGDPEAVSSGMTVGLMAEETGMNSHPERNMPEGQQCLNLGPSFA